MPEVISAFNSITSQWTCFGHRCSYCPMFSTAWVTQRWMQCRYSRNFVSTERRKQRTDIPRLRIKSFSRGCWISKILDLLPLKKFIIVIVCSAIANFKSSKPMTPWISRWLLKLLYDYSIVFRELCYVNKTIIWWQGSHYEMYWG